MLRIVGWVIFFIIVAFICGLIASVPLRGFAENQFLQAFSVSEGESARRLVEQQFGKTFPNTATEFHRANRGDQAYWIQFKIPPQGLQGLFSGSSFMTCTYPLEDSYRPTFEFDRLLSVQDRTRLQWWNPDVARVYVGGECTGRDYKIFRMFADSTNPNLWTFYMEVVRL
ncbi:MAG: hypothetical protein K8I30_16445 [Anaerolineae bacterium]|nr:hypothetical protein [Anaerolineae bacterium]